MLCLQGNLSAQNLVPNSDFSNFSRCPNAHGQIYLAEPWYSPNGRTTDLAHFCAGGTNTGIPQNQWGRQFPFSGQGYAGIRTWLPNNSSLPNRNYREYLATPLLDTLEAGETYKISFQASLGDSARFTSDDLGLAFYDTVVPREEVLLFTPAIANPENKILNDADGWTQISGTYVAKGNESHLVIGAFLDDTQLTLVERGFGDRLRETTYFYIDDVVVEPCSIKFPKKLIRINDTSICPGTALRLPVATRNKAKYTWENGAKDTLRVVNKAQTYTLEVEIDGCKAKDSVVITELPIPSPDLGSDTLLCPGQTLALRYNDAVDSYVWQDGSSSATFLVQKEGIYAIKATIGPCSALDAINIRYEQAFPTEAPWDTLICIGAPLTLSASKAQLAYRWQDQSTARSFAVSRAGTYEVLMRSQCFDGIERFTVQTEDCGCESFIPNVFTPNGDAYHDRFIPELTEGIRSFHLRIADRWGRPVFESGDRNKQWNGTHAGKDVPAGVYFWELNYRCFKEGNFAEAKKTGYVTVLR